MSEVKLPEGWCYACVGDYLYLKNGFAFKSTSYVNASEHTYPVIRISDLNGTHASDRNAVHVSAGESGFEINNGDLLIAMSGATTGKIGVYLGRTPAYQNQRVGNITLRSTKYGNAKYRDFLISSLSDTILKIAYGGAQPNISGKAIEQIKILLPPLAEQQIIADKLDDLLARVESIKTRLENIPEILKKFRQSVLSAAVSGKLTEEWRCQNSTSLEDWKYLSLSDIVSNIEAGKNIKCIEVPPKDNEVGIIKISAVTWGKYDEEESKTLEDDSLFIESRRICVGDFLISRANTLELLGNPVIVHSVTRNLMLSDKVLRLIMPDEDKLWVSIFLRSSVGRKEIESRSTGNQLSMRNIGQKSLLAIPLPYPESDEKREIVKKVEAFLTYAENIENQSYDVLSKIKNLTQSILAKAFRGELTAQWREENPELISGLNSAEALLEKITAEKLATGTVKKRAKKSPH